MKGVSSRVLNTLNTTRLAATQAGENNKMTEMTKEAAERISAKGSDPAFAARAKEAAAKNEGKKA
jgi:hypothetical protein